MPGPFTCAASCDHASAWITRMALTLALGGLIGSARAQTAPTASESSDRYLAPQKDVAILVDVSKSVEVDPGTKSRDDDAIRDARKIVKDLITGKGFKHQNSSYAKDWDYRPGQDSAMTSLFARYLNPSTLPPQSAELTVLARPGGNLLILPVGKLTTVLNNGRTLTIKSATSGELESMIDKDYPRSMIDTSTCFWFAMARAAETLTEQSRNGYYLFVVSDEEDDPDYREEGPKNHTAKDYSIYKSTLAGVWPEGAIRSTIERYFVNRRVDNYGVEQYDPRTGFAKTLIARFSRRNASSRNNPLSISWYAMGVVPEIIRQAPAVQVPAAAPAPVETFVAPKFTPRIQFLGGLGDRAKKYDYEQPLIAWQITHGSLSDLNDIGGSARLSADGDAGTHGLVRQLSDAGRKNEPHTMQLSSLRGKDYRLKLEASAPVPGSGPMMVEAPITYEPRTDFWLMVLAITSLVAAVGIFFFAWRNLRETRVVPLS